MFSIFYLVITLFSWKHFSYFRTAFLIRGKLGMADRRGQRLGNYRVLGLLGQGSFADVYLAEHIHLGTHTAIKILHTQLTHQDEERFRHEARTIARLEHPHIVRVLDFGIEGTIPYLVMNYASQGNVRERHPGGTSLPLTTIVDYVKHVADSLLPHLCHRR
jgi:eukaryotic-like serine/threonine-protein kinase